MKPSHSLHSVGNSEEDALIVAVPSNEVQPAVWKKDPEFVYAVDNDSLFFVNRQTAIEELNDIHRSSYIRAVRFAGRDWTIPFADNIWGLGKSEFGKRYIQKSREKWKFKEDKLVSGNSVDEFQYSLWSCHTLQIILPEGCLWTNDFDTVLLNEIRKELKGRFEVPPTVLSSEIRDTRSFLLNIVEEEGPIFIVFDEIGQAFEYEGIDDFQKREKFVAFFPKVLQTVAGIKRRLYLIAGLRKFS